MNAPRVITPGRTMAILGSSGMAALSALIIPIVTARSLGIQENLEFLVFWSVLFGALGIVGGIQNESTRTAAQSGMDVDPDRTEGTRPRVVTGAFLCAVCASIVFGGAAMLFGRHLVPSTMPWIVPVVMSAIVLYGCHSALSGALAGRRRWGAYSGLTVSEAGIRLLAVLLAAMVFAGALGPFEIAAMVPVLIWVVVVCASPTARRIFLIRSDVGLARLCRNMALAIVSSAAAAGLITGFPAMLRLVSPADTDAATLSSLILAISLTRSPIMIPLQALQGVAISAFVASPSRSARLLARPLGLLIALGGVVAAIAALCGPVLMPLIYGPEYRIPWFVFGALTLASISIAALTLTGTAAIAVQAHAPYTWGWVMALAVTALLLFVPLPIEERAITALLLGPMVGVLIHLWAVERAGRRSPLEGDRGDQIP